MPTQALSASLSTHARNAHCRARDHWQAAVQRNVLCCWRQYADASAAKWQRLAVALCFHQRKLQGRVLQTWRAAAAQKQQARAVLSGTLQRWQQQRRLQTGRLAVCCWQAAARQRVLLQQLQAQLVEALQRRRKQQVSRQPCLPHTAAAMLASC